MDDDVLYETLEKMELHPRRTSNGWSIRCPKHDDEHNSAQCFPDGWIQCYAGCGRFHINKVAGQKIIDGDTPASYERQKKEEIKRGDFTNVWADLDPLDPNLDVKGIDGRTLNKLGWRWYPGGNGYMPGIFIPYFNMDRTKVPFFQIRHLEGQRRFTFAKDITPIMWGFDVLPKVKDAVCFTEGTRDAAILRSVGVPAVAMPSSSSGRILNGLANWCKERNIMLYAVCDKDEAGEGLLKTLKMPIADVRSPVGKDVGDFLEKAGREAIRAFYGHLAISEELI